MDQKYGRLFTQNDVTAIIGWLTNGTAEGLGDPDYGLAVAEHAEKAGVQLVFPADEPLFLLRGQDETAADAVEHYCGLQNPRRIEELQPAFEAFELFRADYPERVKQPD